LIGRSKKARLFIYLFIFIFIAGHIVIAILNSVIAHRTFSSYRAALIDIIMNDTE